MLMKWHTFSNVNVIFVTFFSACISSSSAQPSIDLYDPDVIGNDPLVMTTSAGFFATMATVSKDTDSTILYVKNETNKAKQSKEDWNNKDSLIFHIYIFRFHTRISTTIALIAVSIQ